MTSTPRARRAPRHLRAIAAATAITAAALAAATGARAHGAQPIPDGHAPAGVMVDHMHNAGEFMAGYRYSWSQQAGDTLNGTRAIDNDPANPLLHKPCQDENVVGHEHCMMKQSRMTMQMHMLDLMYAPTNWLTLMVMPQWMTMSMTMDAIPGADDHGMGHAGGSHGHGTDGFGDTIFGGLVKFADGPGYHMHAGLMFSAPTGSIEQRNDSGQLTHYMMQLGSGTWDFLPSVTYTGRADRLSWGLQVNGAVRMGGDNDSGYRLGNAAGVTAWGAYRLTDWLSASLRLAYMHQGVIHSAGHTSAGLSPPDLPGNYGGSFTDIGFGLNTVVPDGALKGHRLGIEWMQPVRDNVNGYQQERTGTLNVNWSKAF